MHAGILRERPDVGAIVHAHPPWSTALSCLRRDIPAFHYMVAVAGGDVIRCADYATFGTAELASAAVAALGERRACLLANHGIIACGATVASALALAVEVEALAGQYMRALSVGRPSVLTEDEMASVLEAFEGYGR
jgi:L-fuculose-phosphate aldolase